MDNNFSRKPTQDNFVTEKVDIYKNNLLGEYDDNGNYSIAPQIVQELIELTKVRKNSYDNSVFCFGNLLGYGEIAFELSYEKNRDSENKAKASLYVLEDVDKVNGYLQNIIKTKLADFVSNVDDFIEQSYAKFNIINEGDDDEGREKKSLDDLELDDSYILAKRAYMLLLDKLSSEKMLDAYGKYFTARLTNLTKIDNEFSNAVLDMFNERYELIEDIFLKEKNYKALNELLDSCIESVSGTKEIYISQENSFNEIMSEYLHEFTDSVNKLNDKAEQKAFGMLEPDDRNKMNQMNATFENLSGSNEVTIEEIEEPDTMGNVEDIENSIDESFQNPVLDAVEEEIVQEEPIIDNSESYEEETEQTSENEENIEDTLINEEISNNEQAEDGIINRILSMQENNVEMENVDQEENEENLEDEISEEYVSSNADFQKNRQNDRLNSITDRLSKLSETTDEIQQDDYQELSDNTNESYLDNKINESEASDDAVKLNKDRFSALFNYLEKKQDEEEMDRDDFSR